MKHSRYLSSSRQRQAGVTLFMVLVIMLLSLTAVLGAFRVANLNESLLGNTNDYAITYAAAEALTRDAEADIRTRVTFPADGESYDAVADGIALFDPANRCRDGICVPLETSSNPTIENTPVGDAPLGVTYGGFTRNALPALNNASNPSLRRNDSRYWVEVFRYETGGVPPGGAGPANSNRTAGLIPDQNRNLIYRITAVAIGRKPGTRVVIKSWFVPNPASQSP